MSTIIIVLLVVVLVVAVVLKKRGDNQGNTASKKGASKTAKTADTKKVSRTTLAREEQKAAPQSTNPIPDRLRQKLEQQIQSGNYQTAEAQINQALKQDNTQHELYLFLLDIHLAQKDDFAYNQLLNQIKSLKLFDIVQAAETKKKEHHVVDDQSFDTIEFSPSHFQQPHTPAATPVQNNTTDFDALVQTPATQSFDDLQSEYTTPAEQEKPAEQAPEVQPLDFNFSFEQKESAEPSPVTETVETKEQQPLEFSFNLETGTTSPAIEESKIVESKPELNFDLSSLEVSSNQAETKSEDIPAPSLDFNFEPSENKLETPLAADKTEFTFDVTETVIQTEPATAFIEEPAPQAPTTGNDPLAQSFPDLQQLDEAQLNLELAEQYIELGAYESARELLKNSQTLLNAEQQQHSEKLLNKIAS